MLSFQQRSIFANRVWSAGLARRQCCWPGSRTATRCHSAVAAAAKWTGLENSRITIPRPDDWHVHLRESTKLQATVPYTAALFKRAIVMPNLQQPVTTTERAVAYRREIESHIPAGSGFIPLMTLYLTDQTGPEEVFSAQAAGAVAFKLYPAGATTNSASGVTDFAKCMPALRAMAEIGMPLLVHGEVTDADVDFFDREAVFIETRLKPLLEKVPELKVVLEHITTLQAVEFVTGAPANIAATITPQHMLLNRNALFVGGMRPHAFCLPILKRENHRVAVEGAATSGNPKFFLGTDSAPHDERAKLSACVCAGMFSAPVAMPLYAHAFESAGASVSAFEAFSSRNGPAFYGLPVNSETMTLVREPWVVPQSYGLGSSDAKVIPMWAGLQLDWRVEN